MADHFDANATNGVQQGPGVPPPPTLLDNSGQPRQWEYRPGWNLPSLPGETRPLTLNTLREVAKVYDVLRKAIEVRKDEFASLKLDIVARDPDRRRARQIVLDQQDKIREIEDFFSFPDRKNTWQSWLRMILEDYFVIDAVSLYKWRDYGGRLHGLRVLDGAGIKPLLTVQGDTPAPPDPAYQQYVWGVARWNFTADELIYAPKNRRVDSPYGFSPVEQFITHITMALRFQRFQLDYFTDGTLPEGVAEAPATWSPKQIQEFTDIWNAALAGDTRALHKLRFVPAGFKFHQFKEPSQIFATDFARWLLGVTCAALDLMPQELGFEPIHGGLGGKGYSEEQSIINKRKAIKPLMRWLCDEILNPVIWEEFEAPGLMAVIREDASTDEKLSQMQARDLQIRNGTMSIDQAIEEDGGEPIGIGRIFVFGQSVLGEPDLIAISKVGAIALNVQGTPPPEGRQMLPAGKTAAEQPKSDTSVAAAQAGEDPSVGTESKSPGGAQPVGAAPQGEGAAGATPPQSPQDPNRKADGTTVMTGKDTRLPKSLAPGETHESLPDPSDIIIDPELAHVAARVQVQREGQQDSYEAKREESDSSKDDSRETEHGGAHVAPSARRHTAPGSPDLAKTVAAELTAFNRFVKARRREGRWRDFRSDVIPPDVLDALNASARSEVSGERPTSAGPTTS